MVITIIIMEGQIFMKTIGKSIAIKWGKVSCLQESISFVIFRSSILRLRGSRTKLGWRIVHHYSIKIINI